RRHTRFSRDWSSDVCSSDLESVPAETSIKVETQLSFDGGSTWEDYEEATNGKGIPGINQQTDLSNALLRYKAILTTNDDTVTPRSEERRVGKECRSRRHSAQ